MDFSTLVKVRQSDRRYKPQAVEADKIELCIEAARLAPSACNSQPWRFIVVDDAALRAEIVRRGLSVEIEMDGGANIENVTEIAAAGADTIVSGSCAFTSPEPEKVIAAFRCN